MLTRRSNLSPHCWVGLAGAARLSILLTLGLGPARGAVDDGDPAGTAWDRRSAGLVDAMRILEERIAKADDRLVRPGTIVAFAGETPPPGWLLCDGREHPQDGERADLFRAIGTNHGSGVDPGGRATFRVPDYRGRFLRGVDTTAATPHDPPRDADRDDRQPMAPGGKGGIHVGSVQADCFRSHQPWPHGASDRGFLGANPFGLTSHSGNEPPLPPQKKQVAPEGGSQTRPMNASVNYVVKT